jgi:hypothetical protein
MITTLKQLTVGIPRDIQNKRLFRFLSAGKGRSLPREAKYHPMLRKKEPDLTALGGTKRQPALVTNGFLRDLYL